MQTGGFSSTCGILPNPTNRKEQIKLDIFADLSV